MNHSIYDKTYPQNLPLFVMFSFANFAILPPTRSKYDHQISPYKGEILFAFFSEAQLVKRKQTFCKLSLLILDHVVDPSY